MPEFLCAFDVGTSAVKAGLFTPEGRLLGLGYREYRCLYPAPGWVEQSIPEMWQAQCEAAQQMLAQAGIDAAEVAAVAVSNQRASFVPLDALGQPLGNLIGWQDLRGQSHGERIRQRVGAEAYYQITGLPIEATAAGKILWLKENAPLVFERARQLAATQNLHLRQLGLENPPCDLADAGYLGLLDVDRLEWSASLLTALDLPSDKLPPLAPSGRRVGEVSRVASEATGLRAGTPVVTAGGDMQCAGLGVGITAPGPVGIGIGTGADLILHLAQPARHPQRALSCLPHVVPGAWEMEGLSLASGAAYKWFRDALAQPELAAAQSQGVEAYALMDAAAEGVPPGARGVLFLPYLMGAGAPHWNPDARGGLLGLTPATDKPALLRAILEGVCLDIRWMLESAKALGQPIDEIRLYGGAARSRLWNQIAADVYGLPVTRMEVSEAGLVGAAICAGVGVGLYAEAQAGARAMVRAGEQIEPNPRHQGQYEALFGVYQSAYRALAEAGIFGQLAVLGTLPIS